MHPRSADSTARMQLLFALHPARKAVSLKVQPPFVPFVRRLHSISILPVPWPPQAVEEAVVAEPLAALVVEVEEQALVVWEEVAVEERLAWEVAWVEEVV